MIALRRTRTEGPDPSDLHTYRSLSGLCGVHSHPGEGNRIIPLQPPQLDELWLLSQLRAQVLESRTSIGYRAGNKDHDRDEVHPLLKVRAALPYFSICLTSTPYVVLLSVTDERSTPSGSYCAMR